MVILVHFADSTMGGAHNRMSYSTALAQGYNGPCTLAGGYADPLQWGKSVGGQNGLMHRTTSIFQRGRPRYEDLGNSVAQMPGHDRMPGLRRQTRV